MKTIIAGSRSATYQDVAAALLHCSFTNDITEVISGCAKGADTHGEAFAATIGVPVVKFPADCNKHGKSAGIKRNIQMAEYADALIAIWDGDSRGTANMIQLAKNKGIPVFVYNFGDNE